MKKTIAMTLALAFMLTLTLTLAACDGGAQPTSDPKPISNDTPAPTPTPTDNSGSSGDEAERRVSRGEKGQFIQTDNAVYPIPGFVAEFPEPGNEAHPIGLLGKEYLIGQLKVQQWEHYFSMP